MKASDMTACDSSVVKAYGYDADSATLYVTFPNGDTWAYENVSLSTYETMKQAQSVGAFFIKHVRSDYAAERVKLT